MALDIMDDPTLTAAERGAAYAAAQAAHEAEVAAQATAALGRAADRWPLCFKAGPALAADLAEALADYAALRRRKWVATHTGDDLLPAAACEAAAAETELLEQEETEILDRLAGLRDRLDDEEARRTQFRDDRPIKPAGSAAPDPAERIEIEIAGEEAAALVRRYRKAAIAGLASSAETERGLVAACWRWYYRLQKLSKGPDGRREQYALAEAAGRPEAAGMLPDVLRLSQAASRARTDADRDRVRQVARQRPALAALAADLKAQAPALAEQLADAIVEERERDALDALTADRPDRTATEWVAALGPDWRPHRAATEAAFARAMPAELGHLAELKGPVEVDPAVSADALADEIEAEAEEADRPLAGRGRVRTSWDPAVWLDAHPDARDLVDFGEADHLASPHPNAADPFQRVRRAQQH